MLGEAHKLAAEASSAAEAVAEVNQLSMSPPPLCQRVGRQVAAEAPLLVGT